MPRAGFFTRNNILGLYWSASDEDPSGLHQVMANSFTVKTHVREKGNTVRGSQRDTGAKSALLFCF